MAKRPQHYSSVTRDAVLAHLAAHPGATKRDIGRALHVQGSDRIALKRILADLAEEGTLEKGKKKSYVPARALPDVTVIEIFGTDTDGELLGRPATWTRDEPPPKIFVVPGKDDTGPALGVGERVLARLSKHKNDYEARIIKRLGASVHRVLGVLRLRAAAPPLARASHGPSPRERGEKAFVEPIDRKTKYGFTVDERDLGGAHDNELVLVEPLSGRATGLPRARVVERLGSMNEPKAVSLIAIHAHGIPVEFPKDAIAEAEAAQPVALTAHPPSARQTSHRSASDATAGTFPLKGGREEKKSNPSPLEGEGGERPQDARRVGGAFQRTDLRNIPLITIDPEDARDHDDAVWAGPDTDPANKGGHVVIVAIADVAHYVTPNSALDRAAWERGNSVYFPDRVVPMLPERLSADLCSLRENEDRPCLAVRMAFDAQGKKRRHEFLRAIMRSARKLTYAQAEAFNPSPGGAAPRHPLPQGETEFARNVMAPLWAAYQTVAKARDERGPLDLDLPERRIVIGKDGKIESIAFKERLESMRLIEEFMIQANVAAAETLEKTRTPLVYRVHEEPSQEKVAAFADYLKTIGIPFAKGQVLKPAIFNRILVRAKGTVHEHVLNEVTLRTQAQAVYAPQNVGHFGLNLAKYAHFTSPIRRYADLVVHRALIRALNFGEGGHTDGEMNRMSETAEHISMTERRAMAAERDSVDRYVAAFMEDRVGAVFEGRISGVTRFGLFVRLRETGADGLLPMRALGQEFFRHDEKRHALVGGRTRTQYALGDTISVRLAEAAPLTGGLRFELASASARAPEKKHVRHRR